MTQARRFALAAAAFGACVMIAQILLFRDLMALSLGSELAIGLIFAGWLTGVSAGSALAGLWVRYRKAPPVTVAACLALFGFSTPLCIMLARCMRPWAGYIQGEAAPFGALVWMIPAAAAPAAFLAGAGFVLLCSAVNANAGDTDPSSSPEVSSGRVYGLEALGSMAGSLLFTFLLVFLLPPIALCLCLAAAMMLAVAVWLPGAARTLAMAACAAAVAGALLLSPMLETLSRGVQWGRADIAANEESIYGNITAIRQNAQVSLFSNGRLAGVTGESPGAAFRAHAVMCLHPHPRRVLLVGADTDTIREMLKHKPEHITVVELDPVLWALRERFLSLPDLKMLNDDRVSVTITDARTFISRPGGLFDIMLVNVGDPETLLVNRYYTREFFRAAGKRLAPRGLFALAVSFQRNSTSAWQADLLGSHLKTMDTVFPRLLLLPGQDGALLVTSRDAPLAYGAAPAVARYVERGIASDRFDPMLLVEALDSDVLAEALKQPRLIGATNAGDLMEYDMRGDRIGYVFDRLKNRPDARVNRDFQPVSTYYQTRVSSELFRGPMQRLMKRITRRSVFVYSICALLALAAVFAALRFTGVAGPGSALTPAAAAAGFSGLVLEIVILFFFQVRNGAVYQFVGLVLAAFMAGAWTGAALCRRFATTARVRSAAVPLLLMLGLCAGLAASNALSGVAAGAPAFLLSMGATLAAGALTGAFFSLATAAARGRAATGRIYAADHAGAALGAACASAFIIPLAGISGALWLSCAALAAGAAYLFMPGRS